MKTFACVLSLFLLASCGALGGIQADQKTPAQLFSLLVELNNARVSTSADLKAMRDAAPAAFDAADKNRDGFLQPRELPRFLIDGKLEARAAFIQVLRNDSKLLRARGDVALADRIDLVLADVDGWLVVLDLFER